MPEVRELRASRCEPRVAAGLRSDAGADIAHVHDEGELMRVDALDQGVERSYLGGGVRRIAEHAERELLALERRERQAAAKQEKQRWR
jgi:hypothetical protein